MVQGKFMVVGSVLIAFSCSCGPHVKDLVVDKAFRKSPVAGSTIIAGGLTSSYAGPAVDTLIGDSAHYFRDILVEKLSRVNILPLEFACQALGDERLLHLLSEFNKSLSVSEEDLETLDSTVAADQSYLVLARFESDRQGRSIEENRDSSGTLRSTMYYANRQLLASFSVWDIRNHKRVWSGQVVGGVTATTTYNKKNTLSFERMGLGAVGMVMDALIEGDEENDPSRLFPATPSLNEAALVLYSNFAEAFSIRY